MGLAHGGHGPMPLLHHCGGPRDLAQQLNALDVLDQGVLEVQQLLAFAGQAIPWWRGIGQGAQ
eukprot:1325736-Lingulodinium_polyedra.AAC.1